MHASNGAARPGARGWLRWAVMALMCLNLWACGGGGEPSAAEPPEQAASTDATLALAASESHQTVLNPVPRAKPAAAVSTTLRVHYRRTAGDYEGWQMHTWGAAKDPGWNQGWNASGSDSFGAYYDIPLNADNGSVGYLFHKGDWKDHNGQDQSYALKAGANEIWRIQDDPTTYASNPLQAPTPDIHTVRVHYQRFGGDYANWGLHLWNGSGLDTSRMPAGVTIDRWSAPVAFSAMPGYSAAPSEVVFDIPVLNPQADANRKALEFIIHGMPPNENDKDGRDNNIRVDYAALSIKNQVGEIWLVERDATVYTAAPDLRSVSSTDARAFWLNQQLIKWPRVASGQTVKLYWSKSGQIVVAKDQAVTGADGALTLDAYTGSVPAAAAERFKWVASGGVFSVRDADLPQLKQLHKAQLVLVQESAQGLVQNATTAQAAGALDALYASAEQVNDLGVTVAAGRTRFKLWAPTARSVALYLYEPGSGKATQAVDMRWDANTGVWTHEAAGDLSGQTYRFAVRVFVRGVGVVRNMVTDPYAISLTADSKRAYVGSLAAAALKPTGWDSTAIPPTVAVAPDMSIYELHVRDFSVSDSTVPENQRGTYLAFARANSAGMQHLKALAQAGLTDVHLLPSYDITSVPERGCTHPSVPTAAPDSSEQQAAVMAGAGTDCFNWGYDPWHYTVPEGSYASSVSDPARRVVEFRTMVQGLHKAGLRVGMDVVYNHTAASGQSERSVLDRIVPGYYHRYNAAGDIERSTCCENTATENLMMGKLMIDSVITWARDYKISSFRFDLMGHQPRAVMEKLQAAVNAATGRSINLLGEGWNFGEVVNGARFVQAEMLSMNGTGIGTFNPMLRDAVRGGSSFDNGDFLISNQGYVNGLWTDPNALTGGRPKSDLMWLGDVIKAGLAGSIRSYTLTTHWDQTLSLQDLNVGGLPGGYVLQPSEVINYFENHDNQTFFDNNVYKLPVGTSREDRARVQLLGAAINSFAQGVPYFHAGVDTLRSKSMDRNSYDSGDWFNRLDWSYQANNFGVGLPPERDNGNNWNVMRPFLANSGIAPQPGDIAWMRDAFRDLLRIRASSTLLRLRTADDIKARLRFHNTGSGQDPAVLIGQVDGTGYAGANFAELVYVINVDKQAKALSVPALAGKALQLHPVHQSPNAADKRAAQASFDAASGTVNVPARTAVVFVRG